jgi:hypothetical protein
MNNQRTTLVKDILSAYLREAYQQQQLGLLIDEQLVTTAQDVLASMAKPDPTQIWTTRAELAELERYSGDR